MTSLKSFGDSLYAPVRKLDDILLRQYTKFAVGMESRETTRYLASTACGMGGAQVAGALSMAEIAKHPETFTSAYAGMFSALVVGFGYELIQNIHGIRMGEHKTGMEDNQKAISSKFWYTTEKMVKGLRAPLFAGGCLLAYVHPELAPMAIGTASSMYLRARDPKSLDKASLWNRVKDGVKEFFYTPMPIPAKK